MIICSPLSGKAVCHLIWAMNRAECDDYLGKALSGIPEHFSGKLLEVPVGTGILTMPVYQTMPEADIVLSLNGFHAFPDKGAAYREVFRVLRPGGTFCGCFFVAGEQGRTDWFVRHVYEKAGFFTPLYETASSLKARLERMYVAVTLGNVKSMAWFICRKAD